MFEVLVRVRGLFLFLGGGRLRLVLLGGFCLDFY